MKLKDALVFLAAVEDAEDELEALEKGDKFELPAKLHVRVGGKRLLLRIIAETAE